MKRLICIAACTLLTWTPSLASAQQAPVANAKAVSHAQTNAKADQKKADQKKADQKKADQKKQANRRVCKRITVTGSHMAKRICRKQYQWQEIERTSQELAQRLGSAAQPPAGPGPQ